MRNYVAYNLARASGRYAARTVYTEVFLVDDGQPLNMEHYNGVYIGVESVKRVRESSQRLWQQREIGLPYLLFSPLLIMHILCSSEKNPPLPHPIHTHVFAMLAG